MGRPGRPAFATTCEWMPMDRQESVYVLLRYGLTGDRTFVTIIRAPAPTGCVMDRQEGVYVEGTASRCLSLPGEPQQKKATRTPSVHAAKHSSGAGGVGYMQRH